jgi:hypothetical protein
MTVKCPACGGISETKREASFRVDNKGNPEYRISDFKYTTECCGCPVDETNQVK